MGIIRTAIGAAAGTVKSGFQDQFLEAIEPEEMDAQTVFTRGVMVRKGSNRPTTDVISDGSVIHVYDNQFMILVDGGKIIDYTAEPGYYTVSNSSAPSMFNGQFDEALKETFPDLNLAERHQCPRRYFISICRRLRELSLEPAMR